jgi:molybdopterin converting factor small subunit
MPHQVEVLFAALDEALQELDAVAAVDGATASALKADLAAQRRTK